MRRSRVQKFRAHVEKSAFADSKLRIQKLRNIPFSFKVSVCICVCVREKKRSQINHISVPQFPIHKREKKKKGNLSSFHNMYDS